MKKITVYGIKNCDTMKKAFQWLDRQGVAYVFHDYKKSGADTSVLKRAIHEHGWENVLNLKGTTWRNLPDRAKNAMDNATALQTALENPSIIRRPLIVSDGDIHMGFQEDTYKKLFSKKQGARS